MKLDMDKQSGNVHFSGTQATGSHLLYPSRSLPVIVK